jgi:hypothetical protein
MKAARCRSMSESFIETPIDSHFVARIPDGSHLLGERIQTVTYRERRIRGGQR